MFHNLSSVLDNDESLSSLGHIPSYPMNETNLHYKPRSWTHLIAGRLLEIAEISRTMGVGKIYMMGATIPSMHSLGLYAQW